MSAPKTGICYKAAVECLYDESYKLKKGSRKRKLLSLVHGFVTPPAGPLAGIRFAHAWVENGKDVLDLSVATPVRMPIKKYYDFLHVEVVIRYSVDEAIKKHFQAGHFGPWH